MKPNDSLGSIESMPHLLHQCRRMHTLECHFSSCLPISTAQWCALIASVMALTFCSAQSPSDSQASDVSSVSGSSSEPPQANATSPLTPPPGFTNIPGITDTFINGGPTTDPNSTSGLPTLPPNATDPAADFYHVDIYFRAFSEARVTKYLSMVAAVVGVEIDRYIVMGPSGRTAIEYGNDYIFSLEVKEPIPGISTGDSLGWGKEEVARRTEAAVLAAQAEYENQLETPMLTNKHSEISHATMFLAKRVRYEKRVTEQFASGVNYMWVAFLITGAVMIFTSIALLWRQRGAEEDVAASVEHEIKYPHDEGTENIRKMQEMLIEAERKKESAEDAEMKMVEKMRQGPAYHGPTDLFEATLTYSPHFALPPAHKKDYIPSSGGSQSNAGSGGSRSATPFANNSSLHGGRSGTPQQLHSANRSGGPTAAGTLSVLDQLPSLPPPRQEGGPQPQQQQNQSTTRDPFMDDL